MILRFFTGVNCSEGESRFAAALFLEAVDPTSISLSGESQKTLAELLSVLGGLPVEEARELCLAELNVC